MQKLVKFLLPLAVAVVSAAPVRGADPVPVPDKPGVTVKGCVECAGRGIEGVVVSDGFNVTKTDADGFYWLKTKLSRSEFVMISTPRGYDPEVYSGFLPKFFYALDKMVDKKSVQQFDFHLKRVDNDDYTLLVVADEHVSGRVIDIPPDSGNIIAKVDTLQFRDDFMPQFVKYADSVMQRSPVYGLNLGDMTHSEYWFRNNTGIPEYLRLAGDTPFMMYHLIGNHDHCHKFDNDYESEAEYRKYFGPTYYSFNLGKTHYVVLDNMLYKGRNKYDKIIAPEQIAWLHKDLKALDPQIRQLVVACHVPLTGNNGDWTDIWYNLTNKDELFALLNGYDVTFMTGDWHTEGTVRINDRMVEYNHTAITGNWWYRQGICNNGFPAAFTEYVFRDGNIESRTLVDWSENNSKRQYRVYNKGVTSNTGIANSAALDPAGGKPSVLVLFWSVAPNWTFVCREDGETTVGRGKLVKRYDPLVRSLVDEGIIPYERYKWLTQKQVYFFLYTPKNPEAEIEIIGTDHIRNRDFKVVTRIEK